MHFSEEKLKTLCQELDIELIPKEDFPQFFEEESKIELDKLFSEPIETSADYISLEYTEYMEYTEYTDLLLNTHEVEKFFDGAEVILPEVDEQRMKLKQNRFESAVYAAYSEVAA